jgi:hypothetical protein
VAVQGLLLDTLRYLADELDASIDHAISSTSDAPADRLGAILNATLDQPSPSREKWPCGLHSPQRHGLERITSEYAELATRKILSIIRAGETELKQLAPLFDLYRQFYQQPADPKLTRRFLRKDIRKKRSVIFLASDRAGQELGFTQCNTLRIPNRRCGKRH